jgi:cytochrome c553
MVWKLGRYFLCLLAIGLVGCGMEPIPESGEARGEVLFQRCSPCHGEAGEGNPDLSAPPIAGMDAEYVARQLKKFAEGVRGKHGSDIEGIRMMPMARTLLAYNDDGSRDDVGSQNNYDSVAAYISSMPATTPEPYVMTGDASQGRKTFSTTCAVCHGEDAKGGVAELEASGNNSSGIPWTGKAPALAGQADWYLLNQLGKFESGVRGANPQLDPAGATMAKWAEGLDEQDRKDLVSFIATCGGPTGCLKK